MVTKEELNNALKQALEEVENTEGIWTNKKRRNVFLLKQDLEKIRKRKDGKTIRSTTNVRHRVKKARTLG